MVGFVVFSNNPVSSIKKGIHSNMRSFPYVQPIRTRAALVALSLFVLSGVTAVQAQTAADAVVESGRFRLHKFQQAIGEESYEIKRDGASLVVTSDFKFTDRGTAVPLKASLRLKNDLTPESFVIKGNIARGSTIDTTVTINGSLADIREGTQTRTANVPRRFFTVAGYAPTTVQMLLIRYLNKYKVKGALPTLPGGSVVVERRGTDRVTRGSDSVELTRYIVSGLIWGRESVWTDGEGNLVALVGLDAEFDHFESVREGYEDSLNLFVSRAAEDGMAALSELSQRISPRSRGVLAIVNANLIDGNGAAPVLNAVVVIENGRIKAVGPRASVTIPKNAKVFDAGGKYMLPGLWDMHAHFAQVEWGPVYLAAGVTTVRDVGNEFDFIKSIRDAVRDGRGLGPRMLLAGIIDGEHPTAVGIIRADTPEQGRAAVNKYKNAGFDQIKVYSSIKPDVLKAICEEAHRLGLTVTGHIPRGMNAIQGVEAGMDQINHISYLPGVFLPAGTQMKPTVVPPPIDFNSPEALKTIQFFKDHHTVFDPTMALYEWILHPTNVPVASFEPGAAKLPAELVAPINNAGISPENAAAAQSNRAMFIKIIGVLHRAGVTIVAGTDQAIPGHSLKRELELYVEAGFTPMEAIQAATIVPARVMKQDRDSGTVEVGKIADLVLVEGNPLENISNLRNNRFVVTNGRLFECAKLWESVGFKP
jgi:imidazolonepropionase-like amidohydrolase